MAVVCEVSRVRFLSIFYSGAACGDAKKYESKLFFGSCSLPGFFKSKKTTC